MILYIGNNIESNTNNTTTLKLLSTLLKSEGYTLKICSSKKNQFIRMLDMLFSILKYRNSIDYILIDTYSTRNFYYAFATSQLSKLFKLKYIPILHGGNLPNRLANSPKMSDLIFKHSYINVAPSNYLKKAFEAKGYSALFIPNVLEIKNYNYKNRTVFRPKLLYVRAFNKLYNPLLAIQVLDNILKDYPKAKLCMVGPDKDGSLDDCMVLAKSLGIAEHIEFTGMLSKFEWHKKSKDFDIFINTTNFDNTPVSVMEAMALGLPIVSTNVGGMPYLIDNNKTGFLVNPNDTEAMVDAIKKIIESPGLGNELAQNARKKVEQFDWSTVKNQWNTILK